MLGMNRFTGKALTGKNHILQSIDDILSTKTGLRIMLRDYGSDLFDLVDRPMNNLLDVEIQAATAGALEKWEPRIKITRVDVTKRSVSGQIMLALEGYLITDNTPFRIEGIAL